MALISCPDCEREVSSSAAACIHCGAPLATRAAAMAAQESPELKSGSRMFLWVVAAMLALMLLGMCSSGPGADAKRLAEHKRRCSEAVMSSMGTSTVAYTDRAAYDARVREACAGLSINGKDLGAVGR